MAQDLKVTPKFTSTVGKQPRYARRDAAMICVGDRDSANRTRLRTTADGVNVFSKSRSGYNGYDVDIISWAGANVLETKDLIYAIASTDGKPPFYFVAFHPDGKIEATKSLDDSPNPASAPIDEQDLALVEDVILKSDLLPELQRRFSDDLPKVRDLVKAQPVK